MRTYIHTHRAICITVDFSFISHIRLYFKSVLRLITQKRSSTILYLKFSNMSDGVSILHIKQEVDTSSAGAACYSPTSKAATAQSNSCNSNSGMKSSPSVSPERQLCSSTTSLSCDLHNVSLSNDGDSIKGSGAGSGSGGGGGSGGGSAINTSANAGSVRDELRRLCLVCGDVASGFHYGVASCEACKAFFKRTIQGNIEYTCPANNECEINKRRRKACQACRFQKCLLMGMLKEGVRLDRVRGGRQKYRRNPVSNSYQTMQLLYQSNTTSLCDVKILEVLNSYEPDALSVQSPSQQPHTTSGCNDEASSSSGSIKLESSGGGGGSVSSVSVTPNGTCIFQNNNNDPNEILSVLSDIYDKELVSVIGWAKQIPGFIELPLNDQMKLLQVSWAEILTLQLTFRSLPFNGKLCFATDVWMDELLAKECGYTEFYYHCVQIAQRMERISPRREEYYLLKALLLSNCDILLDDQSSLRAFRDTILNSLNDVVYLLRHSSAVSHQQQLLLILPSLRQADDILRRFWRGVARDEVITMKKLFLEMLEPLAR
ncbi:steroid hormone receptor ERR2 isoform X1 [Drosophila guanche]|uniref:Blast:WD repeat domain phosphoinositide-interacting protein 2 n=2 Tax=Drosophila guanche TaxID=7266 RepID=A0A3B0KL19_DROGU|nr:steroid hormone receptor ERR2 isoform X1 [Drosophila guanche]SPP87259.1 blast:WD repeat domain phosphoinositide-interacting protein 2 [Drosophila guanche]